jgi:serine/threonine-protein kinase RsbW
VATIVQKHKINGLLHPLGVVGARAYAWSIPSDLAEIDELCRTTSSMLESQQLADRVFSVDLLLREFIVNAMVHGNRSVRRKRVHVGIRLGRKWIKLVVRDEGQGFNWRARRRSLPSATEVSGRGLAIGAAYAARMQFNVSGNQVTLWISTKARKDRSK